MNNKNEKRDANRDPLTCEPGSHPVGTGIGTAAGGAAGAAAGGALGAAAAGAAAGSAAGPIGTAVGLVAGAAIGAAAGHGAGEALNPTSSPSVGRYIDYTVVDRANNKVGTVDAVWQDHTGEPAYLAVRTGWLGMGKAHVVPAQAGEVNQRDRTIRIPFTSEQVKAAPAFDCAADLDNDSENRVSSYYETHGFKRYRRDTGVAATAAAAGSAARSQRQTKDEARMQLKEESVQIGKREVEYGGVRLRKIIRTEQVNQPIELKREEIVIERVPVNETRPTADTNFSTESKEIYIPLRREEAVVAKETHVREEVRVGKRQETERKQVSETVRKEEVEIDREGMAGSRQNAPGTRTSTAAGPYQAKERSRNS